MRYSGFLKRLVMVGSVLLLFACGGGGGGDGDQTGVGIFKDANVSGLSYRSGSQAGVTGPGGEFVYEVGQMVTFSLGGVTLGSSIGKAVVTPVDLVSGGSTSNARVQNMVRFLTMLDTDRIPNTHQAIL